MSIVIPALNEAGSIAAVLAAVREHLEAAGFAPEILVVDDGSTDGTAHAAAAAGARVLRHRSPRGYGAALKTGIGAATHDVVGIIDADDTYPASTFPVLLAALEHADMVVGARTGASVHIPLVRRPAKWALTHLANYVTSTRIPDLNSGLRVFRRDLVRQYDPILPDQFSWTTTITLALLADKYTVSYLPIDYRARHRPSKIVPWDAANFAVLILRTAMLFRPLRVFLPLAFGCLAYGSVKMTLDMLRDPNISASAVLAFLSALQLLLVGMLADAMTLRLGRLGPHARLGVQSNDAREPGVDMLPPAQ